MYAYTSLQWILFFFWYGFLGWIWESCYVSVLESWQNKKWKWVNRGFLHGPIVPIYAFAAISILLATIPVKDSTIKVFVFGALAATILELVTGSAMERLFHVKYWDYSNFPLNFKGYICFFVSVFWGVLSIFMIRVIHVPVERIMLRLPQMVCEVLSLILLVLFVYDFSVSLREALDMRELLEKLTDAKTVFGRLERRFSARIAFSPIPDWSEWKERAGSKKEKRLLRLEMLREYRVTMLKKISEYLHLEERRDLEDREELLTQIDKQMRELFSRTNRQYLRVRRHLKRNPRAISKKYMEALKEIQELFEEK